MGLEPGDRIPENLSIKDCYRKIRIWYQKSQSRLDLLSLKYPLSADYYEHSRRLIQALPTARQVSSLEAKAVLNEVICGYLEWGYHNDDGHYKMAGYAFSPFREISVNRWKLSATEIEELRSTPTFSLMLIAGVHAP